MELDTSRDEAQKARKTRPAEVTLLSQKQAESTTQDGEA